MVRSDPVQPRRGKISSLVLSRKGPTKSDADIKRDVDAELKREPGLDSRDIGVAVKDSIAVST